MLLKIALNGARFKSEHEFIPHSIEEIIKEVQSIYPLGYQVFHIHCYNSNGHESLEPKDVAQLVTSIKRISSQIQLSISTGAWIEPDLQRRREMIENWEILPDLASVNIIEEGAIEVAQLLIAKGVLVEVGLNNKESAEIFISSSLNQGCQRILIEPEAKNIDEAIKTLEAIEQILNTNGNQLKRLLHGFNGVAWELMKEAKQRGYDSRVGMEDTLDIGQGKRVKSNLELVEYARKILNIS